MISKNRKPVEVKIEYANLGNWNYKNKDKNPVYTKPIARIWIDGDEFVFSHEDIFKLLEAYYKVDEDSIKMILDNNINTGEINSLDKKFIDKIKDFVKEKEGENNIIKVDKQSTFNF